VDEDTLRRGFVKGRSVRRRINHRHADHRAGQTVDPRGREALADGAMLAIVLGVCCVIGVGLTFVQQLPDPAEAEANGQQQGEVDRRSPHLLHDSLGQS
jgi:hypothetical protein